MAHRLVTDTVVAEDDARVRPSAKMDRLRLSSWTNASLASSFLWGIVFRTLIVDDEPVARRVLREELDTYEDIDIVGEAENGLLALEMIQRLAPDLVFLDLLMPALGGLDVIRSLPREASPTVIVVTACGRNSTNILAAGAIACLYKPVSPDALRKTINQLRHLAAANGRGSS